MSHYVAECLKVLSDYGDVNYYTICYIDIAYSTNVEGEYDRVCQVVGQCIDSRKFTIAIFISLYYI